MESSSISNTSYEPSKELEPMLNMSQQELLFETFDLRSVCKVEGFDGSGQYHIMRALNPATKKHHRLFILEGALKEDEANWEVWSKCRKAKYQEVEQCEAKMKIIEIEFDVDPTSAARQHFAGCAMNQEDLQAMVGLNIDLILINDLDFESTVKSNTKEQLTKVEVLENEKKSIRNKLCLQIEENEKQSGHTDQILSDNMDDACKTSCKICHKEITLSHMRHHTKDEHKVKVTEYKRMFGDFKKEASMQIIKKVHHKCHICGKILLLDYDHLAKHTKLKHDMPVKDYKSQFLTCTPEEDKSRKQKREAVNDEDDRCSDIGLKKSKSNLMKKTINNVENKVLRRSKRIAFKCNISKTENVNMVKTIQAGNDTNSINVNWNRTSDMKIDYQNEAPNIIARVLSDKDDVFEENDTEDVQIKSRDDNELYMPRQTVAKENTRQSVIMTRQIDYISTPVSHVVNEGRGGQEAMGPLARKEERGPLGEVEMAREVAPRPLGEVVGPLAGAGGFNPNGVSQSVGNHGLGGSQWNGVAQSVGNDAAADVKMKIKINQVTNVEIELTPAQLNDVAHLLPGLQGAVVNARSQTGLQAAVGNAHSQSGLQGAVGNAHSQAGLQAAVGNAHSQTGLQAAVSNTHSQPWLQAAIGNAHSQTGLQAAVGNTHSQARLQAAVGNAHSQTGLQAAVGNTHNQARLQAAVGNTHSQTGLQAAVGNTHSQTGLQAAVGNTHSQTGLQAAVGNTHSQTGLQAAFGNTHRQTGLQAAVGNTHSQTGLQAAVGNTHSQAGFQAPVGNTHSQAQLQAAVGNTHSRAGFQAPVGNTHSQSGLQATVGNTHSRAGFQAPVDNTHSQTGFQAAVGKTHSQAGLQAAVGNTHSQ